MAISTCAKCNNHQFEMVENSPRNSRFKYMFIQCSSCGSVVGITEYNNIGIMLEKIFKKLGIY